MYTTTIYLTHPYCCFLFFSYKQCFDKMLLEESVITSMLLNPTVNSQASFYLTYRDFWHGSSFSPCNSSFTSFPEPHALLVFLRAPWLSLILLVGSFSSLQLSMLDAPGFSLSPLFTLLSCSSHPIWWLSIAWTPHLCIQQLPGECVHFTNISNLTFPK